MFDSILSVLTKEPTVLSESKLGTVSSKSEESLSLFEVPKKVLDYILGKHPKGKKDVVVTGVNSSVTLPKLRYDVQAAKHMCGHMIHIRDTWVKDLQKAVNDWRDNNRYWPR